MGIRNGANNKAREEVEQFDFRTYPDNQMVEIDKKLRARFFRKKTIRGEQYKVFDENSYLVSVGAVRMHKGVPSVLVRQTGALANGTPCYEKPTQYEKAQDMLRQWGEWGSKRAYAARKQVEEMRVGAADVSEELSGW